MKKTAKSKGPIGMQWYSPVEMQASLKNGEQLSDDVAVLKDLEASEIAKGDGDDKKLMRFVISTDTVDRQNDTINQTGWKLDNFMKGGTILWSHDYSGLPIAKPVSVEMSGGKLIAVADFTDSSKIYPFADTVYQMLDKGLIRGTSVGFKPIKYVFNAERGGVDYSEQELLEFSICPVGANPEALVMGAKSFGIDLLPMKQWVIGTLKSGGQSMGLSKEVLAGIVETLEKAVPPVAKAMPGCPKGEVCPYSEGMDKCPSGEECPMKKSASLEALFTELQALRTDVAALRDGTAVVLELDGELLDLPDYEPLEQADDTGVDETVLREVFGETIKEGLRELVGAELNRRRGRLD